MTVVRDLMTTDVFTVQPNGARIKFDRTNLVPFTVDIGTSETLHANGLGGTAKRKAFTDSLVAYNDRVEKLPAVLRVTQFARGSARAGPASRRSSCRTYGAMAVVTASNTICAASGSAQMLNSATGVTLP